MKIALHEITVRDVAEKYIDNSEEGVIGYNGKLNIRPKYQREFIYDDKKRNAVIDTIVSNFPLNVMYWVQNEDGTFEVLDGQQRTISFCQYVNGDFSYKDRYFHNLTAPEQEKIRNYPLMIYFCEGDDKEKLDWFRIINIAGEKFTDQELRNVVYYGSWLTHAKSIFSKSNCAAYNHSKKYVDGIPIRQHILEKALKWISNGEIEKYMAVHQHDPNANELWLYFKNVIDWVQSIFTNYRAVMKGVDWGNLFNVYKGNMFDTAKLENEIQTLMLDDEVTNKKGAYQFVLTRNVKYLNLRAFTERQKISAYEKQKGICAVCKEHFELRELEADHIIPWYDGGKTEDKNCQLLCKNCNRTKSGK